MPHAYGYRSGTRHKFAKAFRRRGAIRISKILTTYRIGDYVDILVDGAIHKGMPHSFYHGRTGRVFNVNPRAVGVIINKQVRNRIVQKRIHVRIEHVRLSTSRESFLQRIRENDKKKAEANKAGKPISTKRLPAQPREAHVVKGDVKFQHPQLFKEIW
jgi:Ribosomal protein L21E